MNIADSDSPTLRRRFVPLDAVAEMFSISQAQAYALVRTGELRAVLTTRIFKHEAVLAAIEAVQALPKPGATAQAAGADENPFAS